MNTPTFQTGNSEKTLELLWARIKQRGELPGFSKVVSSILGAMHADDDRDFNMTKTVLSDPALTQRVLRLANSAMYSVFGQNINTVSKAVLVLGTESIGHLALGLKLVEGLSVASPDSANARSEMEKAVLAGHIGRQIASTASTRDTEEAVVCAMLHSLGRMMVTFYLSDLWQQVQARCAAPGIGEVDATYEILGLGLDEIGRRVARQWGLPEELTNSLRDIPPKPVDEPLDHADWLAAVSTMSSECAKVLCVDETPDSAKLAQLASGYANMLGMDTAQVIGAISTAQKTLEAEAGFVSSAKPVDLSKTAAAVPTAGKPADAALVLACGVVDMRGVLNSANTSQLLTMGLETVYKGLGLKRAIVFLRHQEEAKYVARMCLGDGTQEMPTHLWFDDAYQPDVFHASLANDKMIFVQNAKDAGFASKLPRWWKDTLSATTRSFIVLPLSENRHPLGFIYGDWDASLSSVKIDSPEVVPLNELRALVVWAIEQRRRLDPGWGKSSI